PSHWYQTLSEAACTQVRGGTVLPSVADEHHPYASAHPADDERDTHMPALHEYHVPSLADCTHVPSGTSRSSVADAHVVGGGGGGVVEVEPPANAWRSASEPL